MTNPTDFVRMDQDGIPVLEVRGEIDIVNAADLRKAMQDAVAVDSRAFVISLEHSTYFDSQTLEILVDFSKRLLLSRRRMALVAAAGSPTRRLLDISGISAAIPTYDGIADAVAAIRGS